MKKLILTFIAVSLFTYALSLSQVSQEWVKSYNFAGNSSDVCYDMKLDKYGFVYTVGTSIYNDHPYLSLIKYSADGLQQWAANYSMSTSEGGASANSLAIDSAGGMYLSGQYNGKILTLKYNSNGVLLWSKYYIEQGSDSDGYASKSILSVSGNLYVSATTFPNTQLLILKYNPEGVLLWSKKFDQSSRILSLAGGIVEDSQQNIYLASRVEVLTNTTDYILLKYNKDGNFLWSKRQISGGYPSPAPSLALDVRGNIYLAGGKTGTGYQRMMQLTKYSPGGLVLWEALDYGTSFSENEARSVITDHNGNVYLTGYNDNLGTGLDCVTLKYDSTGKLLWKSVYDAGIHNTDIGEKIILDNERNIYVGGTTNNSQSNGYDYLTVKYDNNGNLLWKMIFNGTANNTDILNRIALDNSGNVFVAGWSSSYSNESDITTIKYSQTIGIIPISSQIPNQFSLSQNYPNPFNPSTKIKFSIPSVAQTFLSVYDILGREITTLVNQQLQPGTYEVNWEASAYPSGVYFYKLSAGDYIETKRMVLLK